MNQDSKPFTEMDSLQSQIQADSAILDALLYAVVEQMPQMIPAVLRQLEKQSFGRGGVMETAGAKATFEARVGVTKRFLEQMQTLNAKT